MRTNFFILVMAVVVATLFSGCEDNGPMPPTNIPVPPTNITDDNGSLVEIRGRIDNVRARKSVPDPGDSPKQFYSLRFSDLDPGSYTIHMCVEKVVDDETVVFDIAQAAVSKNGDFALKMPTAVESEWLDNIPEGTERLWEMTDWNHVELDGIPDEIEISNPEAEMCVADLYMERAEDGQRFYLYYGGPDKESYHTTDLSAVSSSGLLFTSAAVEIVGKSESKMYPEQPYGMPRAFDITSTEGWSWVHYVVNGMSSYLGWTTVYPDWAVMSYSAQAIYNDTP
ncbi:MAG: hypothetical protein LBV38_07400 [Alistipes sp.]|jgi:hypothetical protein|nr:hypothetical protein [Alistipes sp.]